MNRLLKSFFGLTLGVAFSLGVAASLNANKNAKIKETEATAVPTGIYVAFGNSSSWKTWGSTLANISVYFFGGNYGNPDWSVKYSVNTTTGYVATPESSGNRPTKCIICSWGGGNNNQTDDLTIPTNGNCVFTISGDVSDGKQPGSWGSKSSTTTKTLYVDASNWVTGMGNYTPQCHYWDNQYAYDNVSGTNITSVSGGGTISNKKWWSFSITCRDTSSLKFLFMYNNYAMQTGNITYNSSYNAYYLSGTKSAAPSSSFSSTGTIYKITKYKKLASASSTVIGTDYVLGGESYQIPSLPDSVTGYNTPTTWNSSEAGTGTAYTPSTDWINNITSNQTLYALYSVATYTITYDRNNDGESSAKETFTKTYNVAHTIQDPEDLEWEPSDFKRFIGWADSREGIATHNPGDSYTTNAAKTFYYNEDWYNFRYKTDSDSDWIDLNHNDSGLDTSTYMVQFSPSSSHLLNAGDKLYFQYSDDGKASWTNLTVTTYSGSNNNYDTTNGIKFTTTDTIFLKITKAGVYDCWVPGITDYKILVNGSNTYSLVGWGTSGGGKEQMKTTALVYGQKDQILQIEYIEEVYRGYRNGGCAGIEERTVAGVTNLYFTITGMYDVYLIKEDGSHWDNIYVEINNTESANKWAAEFMANVGCDASGTSLPSGWGTCATYYGTLSDATKNIIYGTAAGTGSTLTLALARYDYAVSHHASLTRFIVNSSDTPRAVSSNTSAILSRISITSSNAAIIAIITSLIGVAALGGYFFFKKSKKSEE